MILSFRTTLRISPSSCNGVRLRPSVGREVEDDVTMRLGFRFRFSGASGITSGSLSSLVDRIGAGVPPKASRLQPCISHRLFAEGPAMLRVLHPGVRHYAVVWFAKSTKLGRKSEFQSKGVSQPSYSRSNARSLEASNS